MISRMLNIPLQRAKSFFLFGPRATGKTSWLRQQLPDAIYIDLLHTSTYTELLANPSAIENLIPSGFDNWVVIDEVQRIPALLNEVHRLIEAKKYRFALTGSNARKLKQKSTNLLAGRALIYHMYPLTIQELGGEFDLSRTLQYGLLPALLTEPDPKAYLNSYVDAYLREEVLQEGLTQNLAGFLRFLEIASFSQGEVLNMSAIARDSSVHRKTVEAYFNVLESLLIATRLPAFKKRAKREVTLHPKFYYFDCGVFYALRPKGILDSTREIEGAALETLFFQELRAINDYLGLEYQFAYWRLRTGVEVDFIVYGSSGFHAFEIKRSEKVNVHDCKGLLNFSADYPEAKLHLLYCGKERRYFQHVDVLPIDDALRNLPSILSGKTKAEG
jgi:predicted AAA+ superfamily ATPase